MTFVEELRELSETVELQHKLDRQFADLKTKMKTVAHRGHRSFRIEVITYSIADAPMRVPTNRAENYYCFFTANEEFYVKAITDFLIDLGFEYPEINYKLDATNKFYTSTLITVVW